MKNELGVEIMRKSVTLMYYSRTGYNKKKNKKWH